MASSRYRIDGQRETVKLVVAAMCVAMAFIMDVITKFIPFLHMPQGGAISITLIPLVIAALLLGPLYGVIAGVSFGLLNFFFDGGAGNLHWGSFFLDYTVAFGAVGLVGFFRPLFYRNKIWAYITAIALACLLRYISSSLSGVIFFGAYAPEGVNVWFYSFVLYNAAYMGPTLAVDLVLGTAIYKPLQSLTKTSTFAAIYRVKSEKISAE